MTDGKGKRPTWQEIDEAEHLIAEQHLFQSGVLLRPSADSTAPKCGTCRHPSTDLKPYRRRYIDSAGLCPVCIDAYEALFDKWDQGLRATWEDPALGPPPEDVFARARRGQGA